MLIIRDSQMRAFEAVSRKRYVDGLQAALHAELPIRCARMGPAEVRAWIEHGIDRAATYDITSEEATGRYVRLMFLFGREFDRHPDLPQLRACLTDPTADQDERVNRLTAACVEHAARLRQPVGEG